MTVFAFAVYDRIRDRAVTNASDADDADRRRFHARWFDVARVVDGDTLDIQVPGTGPSGATDARSPILHAATPPTVRIRLWGVDAPESTDDRPMYYGPEAASFARSRLEGRRIYVVLSPRRTRDRYDRLLAYVYVNRTGPSFNEALIETGHAYADPRFPHHYAERFEAAELHARKSGTGLWAGADPDQMPEWKRR